MNGWLIAALALWPACASAWSFSAAPVCTLAHDTAALSVAITYRPDQPEPYAIALTLRDGQWPAGGTFSLRFDGAAPLTIGTTRQVLSDDGRTLTVRDTGFGNVFAGIAGNSMAVALAEGITLPVPLMGAGPPLAAFLDCPAPSLS